MTGKPNTPASGEAGAGRRGDHAHPRVGGVPSARGSRIDFLPTPPYPRRTRAAAAPPRRKEPDLIEIREASGHEVVQVNAPLIQFGNSEEFEERLLDAVERTHGPFVLDMTATTFIGSSGIGVLAQAIRATRDHQRSMYVVTPRRTIRQVFQMTRFMDFEHFHVVETLREVLEELDG